MTGTLSTMTLWFVLALMTAVAIFAVLWPLSRTPARAVSQSGLAIYKDQLDELERDQMSGLISPADAGAARVEISRRLLAASSDDAAFTTSTHLNIRRSVAVLALVALPLAAIVIYARQGAPLMPSFPLAARQAAPVETAPLEQLVTKVEAHLEKNPTDGRGWEVLAPVLARLGRAEDAVRAYRNVVTYQGETATRRADLGEAMAAAAGGIVTADAKQEFERAVSLDATNVAARYFLGLSAQQDGNRAQASTMWRALLQNAPGNAPWRSQVEQALAANDATIAPQISNDAIDATKDMTPEQRNAMVGEMVSRLAERLKANGDDPDGWLRLVRAYKVLGDDIRAREAIADARRAVTGNSDRLREFNDAIKRLGFES